MIMSLDHDVGKIVMHELNNSCSVTSLRIIGKAVANCTLTRVLSDSEEDRGLTRDELPFHGANLLSSLN